MFSTSPTTLTSILRNMSIALVASISARSCGVDTITAPAGFHFWVSVICTSPVPGGMSTIRYSQSPQSPSIRLPSALAVIGPRQPLGGHRDARVGDARDPDQRRPNPSVEPGAILGRHAGGVDHHGRDAF